MPDFPTHLRTVHFTLILACVIIFVSLIAGTENVERAHQQLLWVTGIKANWNLWLNQWGREQVIALEKTGMNQWTKVPSQIHVCLPSAPSWQFNLLGSPLQFYFVVQRKGPPRILVDAVKKVNGDLRFYPRTEQWPVTLDDFKAFWDSVHDITVQIVERIDPNLHLIHADGTMESYPWTAPCATSASSLDLQYRRYDNICSQRVLQTLPGQVFCGDIPQKSVVSLNLRDEVLSAEYHKIRASQGTIVP